MLNAPDNNDNYFENSDDSWFINTEKMSTYKPVTIFLTWHKIKRTDDW